MRRLLSALMLLGLTATAVAQTPQTPQGTQDRPIRAEGRLWSATGRHVTFTSGQSQRDGNRLRLTGGVTVTIDGAIVTAQEATIDVRASEVQFAGDVRLRLN